jgi:hypothetical protein
MANVTLLSRSVHVLHPTIYFTLFNTRRFYLSRRKAERLLLCINFLAHDYVRPFFLLSLYEHQHIFYVSSDMRTILLADWVEKLEEVLLVLQ